jgi:hypothetical protein
MTRPNFEPDYPLRGYVKPKYEAREQKLVDEKIGCWTCFHYNDAHCTFLEGVTYCFNYLKWEYKHYQAKEILEKELFEI